MEGRQQLTAQEVRAGREIASLHIHVQRAIGRMKNFTILSGTIPISLTRLANQIVFVCACLTNFQPALVPPPINDVDTDVEDDFHSLVDFDNCRYVNTESKDD